MPHITIPYNMRGVWDDLFNTYRISKKQKRKRGTGYGFTS